jgi:gamma-glutamyltranspeptidase / glutathione hydrolase / leukotriene-C4 hydrolase
MLDKLYRDHGSGNVPWSELVLPIARMCEQGFPAPQHLVDSVNIMLRVPFVHPTWRAHWLNPLLSQLGKPAIEEGDMLRFPVFARTLRRIAVGGAAEFYSGSVGDDIFADLQASAGAEGVTLPWKRSDLANYQAKNRPVTRSTFRNLEVNGGSGPFSGGPIVAQVLQILSNLDLKGFFRPGSNSDSFSFNVATGDAATAHARAGAMHWVVEALKLAFSHRMMLGDPDFVPEALGVVSQMTNESHSARLASRLRPMHAFPRVSDYSDITGVRLRSIAPESGTSHFSIVDAQGNCVAITTTINILFGSTVVSNRTGIILNDEMDDFSRPDRPNIYGYPPSPANFIAPGKRPLSSMAPTVAVDSKTRDVQFTGTSCRGTSLDRPLVSLFLSHTCSEGGASGGSKIPTATLMSLLNAIVRKRAVSDAVGEARVHHQLVPFSLRHEEFLDHELLALLGPGTPPQNANNTLDNEYRGVAVCQAIAREGAEWVAASDWRKLGIPRAW